MTTLCISDGWDIMGDASCVGESEDEIHTHGEGHRSLIAVVEKPLSRPSVIFPGSVISFCLKSEADLDPGKISP